MHPRCRDRQCDQQRNLEHGVKFLIQIQNDEYHWWDFGGASKQEPNDTLLPEQLYKTMKATTIMAQAKQANEHGQKQDCVRYQCDDEVVNTAPDVGCDADALSRCPYTA